jgi:hypothetical protein
MRIKKKTAIMQLVEDLDNGKQLLNKMENSLPKRTPNISKIPVVAFVQKINEPKKEKIKILTFR